MILLGVRELLSTIRQRLCSDRGPFYIINKEGRGVVVGALSMASLSAIEGIIMRCTNLLFPYPKLPYTIVTDASGTTVGGVLMQDQGNGL